MIVLSQDEYRVKFCPSTVIESITAEATSLINYTLVGHFIHPPPPQWYPSTMIAGLWSVWARLCVDWWFSISSHAPYLCVLSQLILYDRCSLICSSISIRRASIRSEIHYTLSRAAPLGWATPRDWLSSVPIGACWQVLMCPDVILRSFITICSLIVHPVLPIRHPSFPAGALHSHQNSQQSISNSILIHH